MNQSPAISVILPVYNAEAYVREAVESILAQSFTDFECIIINDGSTDGSGAILRELAARDTRIVLVEQPNEGLVSALNKGLEMARADLIARMDADDVSMPERFALQHTRMVQEPELAVLGSFMRTINKAGIIIRLHDDFPLTPIQTARYVDRSDFPVAHSAVMMRRDAVLKAGGYRKAFPHAEDYELWLRMIDLGSAIANLPKPLLNRRWHGANVTEVHWEANRRSITLARLAHRARKAGLPDPFEGVETIDTELIRSVPAHLRQGVEAELFAHRYSRLWLADSEKLNAAWRHYLQLDAQTKCDTRMRNFLQQLFKRAVRKRKYRIALRACVEVFRLHPGAIHKIPKLICTALWQKLKGVSKNLCKFRQ